MMKFIKEFPEWIYLFFSGETNRRIHEIVASWNSEEILEQLNNLVIVPEAYRILHQNQNKKKVFKIETWETFH